MDSIFRLVDLFLVMANPWMFSVSGTAGALVWSGLPARLLDGRTGTVPTNR